MKKTNLRAELDRLKALPSARNMPDFFRKCYIFWVQANYVTDGSANNNVPMEDYLKEFEKTYGTMEESITGQMERWNKSHNKKEEQDGNRPYDS